MLAVSMPRALDAASSLHPLHEKMVGTGYEIARLPEKLGRDCYNTRVTIKARADGSYEAESSCRKGSRNGPEKRHRARAWLVGTADNPSLKVVYKFFFRAQVPVLELNEDADYVVIGSLDGKHLSIASRHKKIPAAEWSELMDRLEEMGIETERLVTIPQN